MKLADFARQWLTDYCEVKLAPMTLRNYKRCIEKRIIPSIGNVDIKDLSPFHVVSFINGLLSQSSRLDGRDKELTGQGAAYCFRVLSSMLNTAVKWQFISNNPCKNVDSPKIKKPKTKALTARETSLMLKAVDAEEIKYKMIIYLAVTTGLRLGELLGLVWNDIDLDEGILQVNRSCQSVKGRGVFTKEPKNETSIRCVTLPRTIIEMLMEYHIWQENEKKQLLNLWKGDQWLFTTWEGKLLNPSTVSHWFQNFLKKYQLAHIPFHGLRHTSATLLINEGASLKNISSRLGHADIRTTGNIYAHALQSVDKSLAASMDAFLNKNSNG